MCDHARSSRRRNRGGDVRPGPTPPITLLIGYSCIHTVIDDHSSLACSEFLAGIQE
jgi:hypothetical protein